MMMMMMMMMGHKSPVRVCVPRGTRTTNRDPVIEIRIEIISGVCVQVCVFHMRARVRYSNALHAHHARGRYDKKKPTHTQKPDRIGRARAVLWLWAVHTRADMVPMICDPSHTRRVRGIRRMGALCMA